MNIITKKIPIYFGYLRIVITTNFTKSVDKLKINTDGVNVENYSSFVHSGVNNSGISQYTIFINPNNISYSIIAHESVHLVNSVFIQCLIQLDRHNDEPQAYLTGWFVEEIHKALKTKKHPLEC